ncbi:MAG: hypothetical protein K2N42_00570, partial [Anaeroplasmataceae bacterium]|nr:hypothetical protein [Anaeroplasmataceae bacterium]
MNYAILLASSNYFKMNMANCSFPLLGKPIVEYLVDSLEKTTVDKILCVIDKKKETLTLDLSEKVKYVSREELNISLFTTKEPLIEGDYTIFIPGNMPFVDNEILERIVNEHVVKRNDFTLGTITKEDSIDREMIERNKNGRIKIVYKHD